MAREPEEIKVVKGSGNVFADLGFENPEEELAKAELVVQIIRLMRAKKLTQTALAKRIQLDQPAVSNLLRGRTKGYTIDRLAKILTRLGQDVEIRIRPVLVKGTEGKVKVNATVRGNVAYDRSLPAPLSAIQEGQTKYRPSRKKGK